MELNDYQRESRKTALYPDVGSNAIYPTLGLVSEAGEVADKVKKVLRDRYGNFDESQRESMEYPKDSQHCIQDYQPDLYYYWDSPIEEDYDWRDAVPHADCLCEICFDILNEEKKIKWKCASTSSGT